MTIRIVGVDTPPGGILTRQAGAVTGRVQLRITTRGAVELAYEESDDWYRVVGSAKGLDRPQIVALLTTDPGCGQDGNPIPARLR